MSLLVNLAEIGSVQSALSDLRKKMWIDDAEEAVDILYTGSPVLQSVNSQLNSFWIGQPGDVFKVVRNLAKGCQWLEDMLSSHVRAVDFQDGSAAKVFSSFDFAANSQGIGTFQCFNPRDTEPFSNLDYATPVALREGTATIAELLVMFQSTDAEPLQAAQSWENTAQKLTDATARLRHIAAGIDLSTEGISFEEARRAVDDFAAKSQVVANNANLMADTVRRLPSVRMDNLSALQAIQGALLLLPDPGVRATVEREEVTRFVSTQLQPSLEQLKPSVTNFGVPVLGHTGGGGAQIEISGATTVAEQFSGINGGLDNPQPVAQQDLGAAATQATANADPVNPQSVHSELNPAAPQQLNEQLQDASSQTVAPAGAAPANVTPQPPAAANLPPANAPITGGQQPLQASPGALGGAALNRGAALAPHRSTARVRHQGPQTRNSIPPGANRVTPVDDRHSSSNDRRRSVIRPTLPAHGPTTAFSDHHQTSNNQSHGGKVGVGNGNPGSNRQGGNTQTAHSTPHGKSQQPVLNERTGYMGTALAGTPRGGQTRKSHANKKATGRWGSGVTDYFKRQFLGPKPKTTRKTITK